MFVEETSVRVIFLVGMSAQSSKPSEQGSRSRPVECIRVLWALSFGVASLFPLSRGQAQGFSSATGSPPVRITYPKLGSIFTGGMRIQVRAEVTLDPESVREVRFATQDSLIDVVTDAPYFAWLSLDKSDPQGLLLTATVVTQTGTTVTSPSVRIFVAGGPSPFFEYEITLPAEGDLMLPSQSFDFSADTLALPKGGGPHLVQLLAGTNVVDTFAAPPYSMTVTNLPIGSYVLTVDDRFDSRVKPIHVCVAELGIRAPRVEKATVAFEVVTAFPGRETLIQTSTNLLDWITISTNRPSANVFKFVDPGTNNYYRRFYRAVVP